MIVTNTPSLGVSYRRFFFFFFYWIKLLFKTSSVWLTQGYEDWLRHKADKDVNHRLTTVIQDEEFLQIQAMTIQVRWRYRSTTRVRFTSTVKINAYLSSLPILAVVYRFFYLFYLPTANLPIYHNLPISTDCFADLPNFNFFYRSFCYFM